MPVPSNTTPATAMDLGALPFSITQDIQDAPDFNVRNEVWYQYTHLNANEVAVPMQAQSTTFTPVLAIFDSLDHANAGDEYYLNFVFVLDRPIQVPVVAGQTYYIRVGNTTLPTPALCRLSISGQHPPMESVPVGSFFINDDTPADAPPPAPGFPNVAISATTGEVLRLFNAPGRNDWPAGESGAMLPNGISMWNDTVASLTDIGTHQIYSAPPNFTTIATVTFSAPNTGVPVCVTNKSDAFYVGYPGNSTHDNTIHKVRASDGAIMQTWETTGTKTLWSMAVSPDEGTLYYTNRNLNINDPGEPIKRWNLNTDSAMADFNAGVATAFFTKDLLCLSDGTLLVGYVNNTGINNFVHYAVDGSTILDHSGPSYILGAGDRWTYGDDDSSFWIFTNLNNLTRLVEVQVSDGAVLTEFNRPPQFENGIYTGNGTDVLPQLVGNSNSCPVVRMLNGSMPVPENPPGSISVSKAVVGTGPITSFTFHISGGLDPATFTLAPGQTQTFLNVPAGTYVLTEDVPPGYQVNWTFPPDAIVVTSNNETRITAINQPAGGGGTSGQFDPIRCVRQSPHLSTEQLWQFFANFQLDCETGVGLPDNSTPYVLVSWSDDGGHTWSQERFVSMGQVGHFRHRARIVGSLGRSRDRVWRVVQTDPVPFRIVQALVDVTKGTS